MEGEALLLGIWRNIEDLEDCLSLPELELVIKSKHDEEDRHNKWLAAVNGIDLDANSGNKESAQDKVNKAFEKFDNGGVEKTEREKEADDLSMFGISIKVEH